MKKVKSRQKKLDLVLEFLTESHLEIDGGYPYDQAKIGSCWVIAGLSSDGSTEIQAFEEDDLIDWYDRAMAFLAVPEHAFEFDLASALYEVGFPPDKAVPEQDS
jgi:hypothetical protein